jgi:hypothetical protein
MNDARERFIQMVEDGMLDPMSAVVMCAKWMPTDDVEEMMEANELDDPLFKDVEEDYEEDLETEYE